MHGLKNTPPPIDDSKIVLLHGRNANLKSETAVSKDHTWQQAFIFRALGRYNVNVSWDDTCRRWHVLWKSFVPRQQWLSCAIPFLSLLWHLGDYSRWQRNDDVTWSNILAYMLSLGLLSLLVKSHYLFVKSQYFLVKYMCVCVFVSLTSIRLLNVKIFLTLLFFTT